VLWRLDGYLWRRFRVGFRVSSSLVVCSLTEFFGSEIFVLLVFALSFFCGDVKSAVLQLAGFECESKSVRAATE